MSDDLRAQDWPAAPGSVGRCFWRPYYALWRREITGFLRQRSRIAGALGTPLVFWLLAGAGRGESVPALRRVGIGLALFLLASYLLFWFSFLAHLEREGGTPGDYGPVFSSNLPPGYAAPAVGGPAP